MPCTAVPRRRRVPAISVVALVVLGLVVAWFVAAIAHAAALSDTIIIPESEIPKASCSDLYSQVRVAKVAEQRWTSSDMKGHIVVFPDGITAQVGDVADVTGLAGGNGPLPDNITYVVENLGKYGVIAVRTDHGHRQYWGSSRGIDLLKKTPKGI
jgi:hypothetical protein